MPSICELPQGSAPGGSFTATRRLMLTSCSSNFGGLSEPEPIATVLFDPVREIEQTLGQLR